MKKKVVCNSSFFFIKKSYQFTHDHVLGFLRKHLFCCLKYDFTRQLHRDERFIVFFASCTMSLGLFPTSTCILCVVGYVRYTTNVHTMGICCVLLEPPINVAYLLQCIAI